MRIDKEEWKHIVKEEKQAENRQIATQTVTKALQKSVGRELSETEKPLAASLAGRIMGEKAGNLRDKHKADDMPWGGIVLTERDVMHCICGLLISDHTPEKMLGVSCPYTVSKKR